jgi:hypothetical protein
MAREARSQSIGKARGQMPMRHELVIAQAKRDTDTTVVFDDILLLTAICLAGAVLAIYLSSTYQAFEQMPLLIVQYNLG